MSCAALLTCGLSKNCQPVDTKGHTQCQRTITMVAITRILLMALLLDVCIILLLLLPVRGYITANSWLYYQPILGSSTACLCFFTACFLLLLLPIPLRLPPLLWRSRSANADANIIQWGCRDNSTWLQR